MGSAEYSNSCQRPHGFLFTFFSDLFFFFVFVLLLRRIPCAFIKLCMLRVPNVHIFPFYHSFFSSLRLHPLFISLLVLLLCAVCHVLNKVDSLFRRFVLLFRSLFFFPHPKKRKKAHLVLGREKGRERVRERT